MSTKLDRHRGDLKMKKKLLIAVVVIALFALTYANGVDSMSLYKTAVRSKSCNVDGSASTYGVECYGKNEDGTDATHDACLDGTGNPWAFVNNIKLSQNVAYVGDVITVECEVCKYDDWTRYNILHHYNDEWSSLDFGQLDDGVMVDGCSEKGLETVPVKVVLDNPGEHIFRCWSNMDSDCTVDDHCCGAHYGDNDDMSIFVYEKPKRDLTPRSCNVDGSASTSGVECYGKNEDGTDATVDSCTDGSGNPFMFNNDIFVSATKVFPGDIVKVTCEVCPYGDTEYSILYYNGKNWVNKAYGDITVKAHSEPCPDEFLVNKSVKVRMDNVIGTHIFRCQQQYSSCTENSVCCSETYSDNDDMSIEVISPYYLSTAANQQ